MVLNYMFPENNVLNYVSIVYIIAAIFYLLKFHNNDRIWILNV